jgi:hypothetical protein
MLRGAAPPFVLNRRHVVKSSTNLAISLASRTVRGLLCRTGAKGIGRQQLTRECGARAAPGMKGSATITTTTTVTPVYVTEVRNAEVVQASASSIIVRGQNGFQMYTEGDVEKRGIKIFKNGRPVSFSDLHTRDKLTATIVTEGPPKVVTEREVQARLSSPPPPSSAGAAETARAAEPARAANPPVASPPPPPAQPPAAVATPPASAPVAAPSSASPTREAG